MRIRRKGPHLAEADLTPMIDMTFQLIAFFMVLINFTEADQNQEITLPQSQLAKPPEAPFEYPIFIQLRDDSQILFGVEEVPLSSLRTYMARETNFLRLKEKSRSDATVIIRADLDAKTGDVQKVIQICQELKFDQFALRAKQEELH